MRQLGAFIALLVIASCASFGTADDNDDDDQPGTTSSSSSGTGTTSSGASGSTSGTSGATTSGSTSGGGTNFCAGHAGAKLCADFDGRELPSGTKMPAGTTHLTHTTTAGPGAEAHGNALRVDAKNVTSDFGVGQGAFQFQLESPITFKTGTVSFRVLVEDADWDFARLGGIFKKRSVAYTPMALNIFGHAGGNNMFMLEGTTTAQGPNLFAPKGVWHQAVLTLNRSVDGGGTIGVDVAVNGTPIGGDTHVPGGTDTLNFALGAFDSSQTNSRSLVVWFDDILVELQ